MPSAVPGLSTPAPPYQDATAQASSPTPTPSTSTQPCSTSHQAQVATTSPAKRKRVRRDVATVAEWARLHADCGWTLARIAEEFETMPSTIFSAINPPARKKAKITDEMVPTVIRTLRSPAASLQDLQDAIVASHGDVVPMDQIKSLVARDVHGRLTPLPVRLGLHDPLAEEKFRQDLEYLDPNDTRNIIWVGQAQAHITLCNGNTKCKDLTGPILPPGDLSNKYLITTAVVAMTFDTTIYDRTYFGLLPREAPAEHDEEGTPIVNSAWTIWQALAATVEQQYWSFQGETLYMPTCIIVDESVLDAFPVLADLWAASKCIFYRLPPCLRNLSPVHAYAEDLPPIVCRKQDTEVQDDLVQRHILKHWDTLSPAFSERACRKLAKFRNGNEEPITATNRRLLRGEDHRENSPEMIDGEASFAALEDDEMSSSSSDFPDHLLPRRGLEDGHSTCQTAERHVSSVASSRSGRRERGPPQGSSADGTNTRRQRGPRFSTASLSGSEQRANRQSDMPPDTHTTTPGVSPSHAAD
ncbi:hypothetical protein BCV69DRAFT_301910 [Microstroma glucosiphilum]|uniref:Uncharacterized protein n=1 Tax=Pseudomicrostroma glucosiphilum TaxID=1684307 RepID=A0A316TWZ5_9BASI|nr:hypothetical protein BCV69DRAFT_301910 [Pseudomicrostroma glucosiphilum]PWN17730.1 hypothetical protein BCV69DRAFT_301910 [Pseudomicrostroma glucosiphilum]